MAGKNFKNGFFSQIFNYFPLNIIKYLIYGLLSVFLFLGKLVQYFIYGFSFPIIIFNFIDRVYSKIELDKTNVNKEQKRLAKEEAKFKKQLLQQEKEEKKLRENVSNNGKKFTENEYVNENVIIEKKNFKKIFNGVLDDIFSSPGTVIRKIKDSYRNSALVKDSKNRQDINRQALLVDLNGLEEEKSNVKLMYQYIAKTPDGKSVKGYFEAYSKIEVLSYLISEGFEVYNIKTNKYIQLFHSNASYSKIKMANKDLIFFLTQLSTYIKSGIPLVDSLKILAKQYKKPKYQYLFKSLIYDLSTGSSFSEALFKQGNAFPKILVNMVKASEMTGELPETLDDMSNYFTQIEKTRKQMTTAMMYPTIIMFFALAVITFILIWVIPQFVEIYESMDAAIPAFTQMILNLSAFFQKYIYHMLIIFVILILVLKYLYDNVKAVRFAFQWFAMHVPVFSSIIIYNEVTVFTKTFASLLAHNVFITDSMEILNQITNNEVYKMIILDTITNLARGEKISKSFENHWAFPLPAYEMLVTGEKTGQLPEMMKKVSDYYQELHTNSVSRVKTFMEPVLIVFLTVVVGAIVLAIIIPMFGMYTAIQDLG